mmetsp:Transcript_30497/g.46514  ORF Transcript_30497/g.46514 Transcript_30497/m.46514 type:complete len:372 (+) Transcript_30497:95-1210(+)
MSARPNSEVKMGRNKQTPANDSYYFTEKIKLPNNSGGARIPKKRILERQRSRIKKDFSLSESNLDSISLANTLEQELELANATIKTGNLRKLEKLNKDEDSHQQQSRRSSIRSRRSSIQSRRSSISSVQGSTASSSVTTTRCTKKLILEKQQSLKSIFSNNQESTSASCSGDFFRETIGLINGKFQMRKKWKLKKPKSPAKADVNTKTGESCVEKKETTPAVILIPTGELQGEKPPSAKETHEENKPDFVAKEEKSKEPKSSKVRDARSVEKKEDKLTPWGDEKKGERELKKEPSKRRKRTRKKDKLRRQRSYGNDSATTGGGSAANSREGKKDAIKRRAQSRKRRLLEIVDRIIRETKGRQNSIENGEIV